MTGPLTGVPAAQVAMPQPLEQGTAQVKQGDSRFDGVLAQKAQASPPAQAPTPVEPVPRVEGVSRTEQPTVSLVSHVVRSLEQGQLDLEKLIQAGTSGRQFSNGELLSLQASMYKYTQELDLTSKVVEKATSGLKDVVKTQV